MSSTQSLLAYALVTPLSTTTSSSVPIGALAVIEWCVFDGHTHESVVEMYNAAGYGSVSTKHGISYQLRRWGSVWYKEQGAVRPWELYTRIEKEHLKKKGLSGEDFKFVHPRDLDVMDGVVHVRGQPRGEKEKRQEAARRRSCGKTATTSVNSIPSRTVSPLSSGHRATSFNSLSPDLPARVQSSHPTSEIPLRPIPESLKLAIKAKQDEWLEANKLGKTGIADLIEEEMESLERQAMEISRQGFLAWKFGDEHIGAVMS